ncbi:MAG: tRNA (adenosine(37)-N6)-threonylcarbamoyltransferase complex dimerization subunit type 1 TsaB [Acidimicrobiaceae bacterium]|nr:tRNA (adenosine(37)-N6)-threonylcarbamoyltransferase complex dimerization subunit type 1 TsaB [Acidimicrobiaceae bacterium]
MRAPLILGIESATSRVGCAVGGPDGVLAARESSEPRRHAESLVPQIAEALGESGVAMADVGVIAVDVGPGLYTGLRVGVTTAVTMAHALGAAMVSVTSLELVAHEARRSCASRRIDAVIDARRGELFHAAFGADGCPISGPAVLDPRDLAMMLASEARDTLLVGDGVEAHSETFAQKGFHAEGSPVLPSAETIVELAATAAAAGRTVSPDSIRPLYLRGPDAQPIGTVA